MVQTDFKGQKEATLSRGETWADLHARLTEESSKRLNRFIQASSEKIKAEQAGLMFMRTNLD
ncbi:unnamed protein product [Protopolystoma xenopodis]|uniref:Uncharacterized protein n=1 Tax=Protopolystoma xenopodis TaxID=117903 RepID=A0A448X2S6_9PLAT|nr:unnamed protein product [Protopolystoma xenopodis]